MSTTFLDVLLEHCPRTLTTSRAANLRAIMPNIQTELPYACGEHELGVAYILPPLYSEQSRSQITENGHIAPSSRPVPFLGTLRQNKTKLFDIFPEMFVRILYMINLYTNSSLFFDSVSSI